MVLAGEDHDLVAHQLFAHQVGVALANPAADNHVQLSSSQGRDMRFHQSLNDIQADAWTVFLQFEKCFGNQVASHARRHTNSYLALDGTAQDGDFALGILEFGFDQAGMHKQCFTEHGRNHPL